MRIDELEGRFLRVVTLSDKLTIHNAFLRSQIPAMKLSYFPDTDSLYIDLSQRPGVESQEVSEGVALDYDAEGNLAGIDIDHASRKLNLGELVTSHIPLEAVGS
ncbi:hypothetical protein BH18VER1_BH18VER1_22760 [soil metagenome]